MAPWWRVGGTSGSGDVNPGRYRIGFLVELRPQNLTHENLNFGHSPTGLKPYTDAMQGCREPESSSWRAWLSQANCLKGADWSKE